jgi:hypothetical protein
VYWKGPQKQKYKKSSLCIFITDTITNLVPNEYNKTQKEKSMSKQTLRYAILVLGLITAVIHTVILPLLGFEWLLMPLNGLGFFVLTGLVFFDPAFLSGQRKLVIYLFMAYTLVTIVGYFVLNSGPFEPIGIITKLDEFLLLIALWLYKDK